MFVAALRDRLMAEAETALVAAAAERADTDARLRLRPTTARTRRERRLAAVVGGLALVGATTSVAVAAQSALPGDALYPVKRAIETAHTGSPSARRPQGRDLLGQRRHPPRRGRARSAASDAEPTARIADTLDAFTEQAIDGSDLLLADYAGDRRPVVDRPRCATSPPPAWTG